MNNKYVFRRTVFVTIYSALLILFIILAILIFQRDTIIARQAVLLSILFLFTVLNLFKAAKGMVVAVKENGIEIFNKKMIDISKIEAMNIAEKEVTITASKGVFIIGRTITFKKQRIKESQMWTSFLSEMMLLKENINK